MNKICTSIEQSKKLIELGIDVNTADMYWWYNGQKYYAETIEHNDFQKSDIPCWSLAALLSVLPLHLIIDNQRYAFSMIKGLNKNGETYAIKYALFNTTFYFHLTDFYNNPVDAVFEMIQLLHEQKIL